MSLETQNGVMPVSNNKPPPTTTTTTIESDIQQQNHQNLQQPQDQRPEQIIIEQDQQMEQQAAVINGSKSHEKSTTKQPKQTDANISFLRAARSGDLEKVIEFLESGQVTDINTCNANGLNALHLAAKDGYVDIVSELLKRGANVDNATKKGNTALHIASLAGQKEVIKLLIQYNANVNVQSLNGFTPLYMAAQENHDACVRYLLAKGANPSLATEDGFTPLAVAMQQEHDKVVAVLLESDSRGKVRLPALHIAAKKDDVKAATLLLENEHNPDIVSKSGFTPLHIAAHYGNVDIANLLIEKGADVNFTAKHNITPLHVACKWGKTNMLQLLLSKGAKIDSTTRDGLTPLHCAARSGHEKVIEILLKNNAPILSKTKNGLAPLHMAAQGEHDEAARILLQHKAPVDEVTVDYLTALHVAAHCGHVKVAKLLLDHNADPNARALNGFTPLHIACKKNRIKVVELLLKHNASISATTESGLTPLHVASFMGCMNIVIYLLQHDANPDAPTIRGETPLHLAARANQTDIIRILLRNGSLVDVKAREGQTPLHVASRLGNIDIVMLLLQHGANVDSATKDLYTPLHIASKEGQEDVAAVLIENQASLDATTKKGFSPLHLAAKYGNVPIAQLLLQKGAAVDAQGKNGVTPLHVASHYDHQNVALLLLEKGASPHTSAKNGHTALHIAAKKNQMDIATHLLQYGAKANAESKSGFTPLHLAAQEGHVDMVNLLLEHKADPNLAAKNGLTAMHLCAQEDKTDVAKILLDHQATIDERTKAGYTPLHVAAHFGQVSMVKFLLENDAKIELTTNVGYTPLHQAAQQGHTLIINLLLKHKANPNALTNNGQTALNIANRLGYVTAVETLKIVTETSITSTVTGVLEEKYKVIAPESMHETFMSDSEDECGEDHIDQHQYKYMATDDLKTGGDTTKFDTTDDGDRRCLVPLQETVVPSHYINQESTSPYIIKSVDNVNIVRQPIHVGFLVSFLVDARGGAMRGCRHSGVRVIVPPKSAAQPTRITCRYVKPQRIPNPPPLMEGEALVSRILELSPVEAKFLGPVILEVPHFGSLRDKEREIIILRSDNGETWREHTLYDSEEAVRGVLNESFDTTELNQLEDLHTNRIIRIVTHDFPHYFAIVSRIRQEVHAIGPDGGTVSSIAVPQVQAIFPPNALTKKIRVGLQAQPVDLNGCAKLLGQGVAVSPVVTVEPRRRKFHKAITLSMPAPRAHTQGMINQYSGSAPTLRLLCSITGGQNRAIWEDVTGSTPLTFVKDSVSFTTTVSARFWLMDCRNISDASRMATDLYSYMAQVPFMVKFVVFAKRVSATEAKLSVFCMTDDKEDKTLEQQEYFTEIAKSRDVEVLEDQKIYLEFAGNLIPVMKSGEQLNMQLHAFRENRLSFTVRVKDTEEPFGRISFMNEPKVAKGDAPLTPICTLNVSLAGEKIIEDDRQSLNTSQKSLDRTYRVLLNGGYRKPDEIHKADIRLSDICNLLENDWVNLANELDVPETDIELIKSEYPDKPSQQAMIMLRLWLRQAGPQATGNNLEQALHKIKRSDIVDKCIFNLELVTDEMEKAVAKMQLDQSGFDNLKEELGPSRDTSLRRNQTIDQNYADKLDDSADEKKDEMAEFNGKDAIERRGENELNSTLNAGDKEFDRSLTPSPIPIEHGSKIDDKIPPTAKPEITDLSQHEDNKMKGRTPDEKRKIVIRVPDEEKVPDDAESLARQILDDLEMAAAHELRLHQQKDQMKTQDQDGVDSDVDDKIMAALPTNKVKTIKKHSKVNSIITQQQPTRPTVGDIEWDLSVTSTPEKADLSPEKASEKKVIEISTANLENVLPTETTQSEEVIEIVQSLEPIVTSPTKDSNRIIVEEISTQLITPPGVQERKLEQILPTSETTISNPLITSLSIQEKKLEQILPTNEPTNLNPLITSLSFQEKKLGQILPTSDMTTPNPLITSLSVQEKKLEQILPNSEVTVSGNQIVTNTTTIVNPDGSETITVTTEELSPSGEVISRAVKTTTSSSHVDSNIEIDTDLINTIRETLTNFDSVNSIDDLQQRSQQQQFSESEGSTAYDSTGDQQQNKMHIVKTKTKQVRKNQGSSSDSDIALHEPGAELSEDETEADFYQGSEQPITITETTVDEISNSDNGTKVIKTTTTTTTAAVVRTDEHPIEISENQKLFDSELAARSAKAAQLDDGLPSYESAVIQHNEPDDHELRESMQKITNQFMCEERKHC